MDYPIYEISKVYKVRYIAVENQFGITDLTLSFHDPDNIPGVPQILTENTPGIYETDIFPDKIGHWWLKISSVSFPLNIACDKILVVTRI